MRNDAGSCRSINSALFLLHCVGYTVVAMCNRFEDSCFISSMNSMSVSSSSVFKLCLTIHAKYTSHVVYALNKDLTWQILLSHTGRLKSSTHKTKLTMEFYFLSNDCFFASDCRLYSQQQSLNRRQDFSPIADLAALLCVNMFNGKSLHASARRTKT